MTSKPEEKNPKVDGRKARLAAELRANLLKRKLQARQRKPVNQIPAVKKD